jgi:hypothetical protein
MLPVCKEPPVDVTATSTPYVPSVKRTTLPAPDRSTTNFSDGVLVPIPTLPEL